MPVYTLIRVASIALVALLHAFMPERAVWVTFIYCVSFGHYILGVAYSRKQIGHAFVCPRSRITLGAVLATGVGLYLVRAPSGRTLPCTMP